MCGIAGRWDRDGTAGYALRNGLSAMVAAIHHRGPDGDGTWLDEAAGLGLGHVRLAIQDLSPLGAQPMHSASGRYVITYNGEIYNVAELRADLSAAGCVFQGSSDTEVFLAGVERWGLEPALRRCAGMFAMALWDRQDRVLTLIRDRLGKKPLYVLEQGGALRFASELKGFMADPAFRRRVDPASLASYFRFGNVPGTAAIFEGVRKVAPGGLERHFADGRREFTTYWDLAGVARWGTASPASGSHRELADRAEAVIDRAVRDRLVSDVPVGAFLSGGIDSSLVVALMNRHVPGGARTFSIAFDDPRFNEAPYAASIARHLGTRHSELHVTGSDALNVIPGLPEMFDEPFADSSQIPTFLVAKLARAEVTVALTGDGGDEIAGGYRRHVEITGRWKTLARVPRPLRRAVAALGQMAPAGLVEGLFGLLGQGRAPANPVEWVRKASAILAADDARAVYRGLVSLWPDGMSPTGRAAPPSLVDDPGAAGGLSLLGELRYLDMATYLPDDVLTKVDRATMAVALEARSPLLDHRVVEFFWSLPDDVLVRDGTGKVILRDILARHVPPSLFDRPKTGFGVPLAEWLKGPLRDWGRALLEDERRSGTPLDLVTVDRAMDDLMRGQGNHQHRLWAVFMFLAWKRRWQVGWA
ncbi:asparagine synthase (glutamine-hydrolyzing) [Alsobacter sp. R-9]